MELIKEYWRSNKCTYEDLEHFQEEAWGKIDFTKGSLRSIASAEGWNKEKNIYEIQKVESHKNEIISQGLKSLDGMKNDLTLNEIKRKGISKKYLNDLKIADKLIQRFGGTFKKKGNDVIISEAPNKAIVSAQKIKMESTKMLVEMTNQLMGIRSLDQEDKLKMGLINLELNISKQQFDNMLKIKRLELDQIRESSRIDSDELDEIDNDEFDDYFKGSTDWTLSDLDD